MAHDDRGERRTAGAPGSSLRDPLPRRIAHRTGVRHPALGWAPLSGGAVALVAGLWATGCATPGIQVRGATIAEPGAEKARVGVELELTNPADDTMRLLTWDYSVTTGTASYTGQWEALVAIPPDKIPIRTTLPCVLPAEALDPAAAWTISGTVSFRSPSRLARIPADLGLYRPTASFSGGGVGWTSAPPAPAAPQPSTVDVPSDSGG